MRKLFISFLLTLSVTAGAQPNQLVGRVHFPIQYYQYTAIYAVIPVYNPGFGVGFLYRSNEYAGLSSSITYCTYDDPPYYIEYHMTLYAGLNIYLPLRGSLQTSVGVGPTYNILGDYFMPVGEGQKALNMWSFKIESNWQFPNGIFAGLSIDPIKMEPDIKIGYTFKYHY